MIDKLILERAASVLEIEGFDDEAQILRNEFETAGWHPIKSAPRDGTRILIWVPNDDDGETYKVAYWGPKPHPTGWNFRGGWLAADEPECWQQLQPPPKS